MSQPAPPDRPDRIHLRGHIVAIEVGAFADERDSTQRLRFDVEASLRRSGMGAGDDVDLILSYDVLVAAIDDTLAQQRFDLLEAIAEGVAGRVLADPAAAEVTVTVEKLDRVSGALGVTITRSGGGAGPAGGHGLRVVMADDWRPADGPAVLVPSALGLPLPDAGDPVQLALLALDQAALAAADRLGLKVAATRTELMAAAGAGRAVVWAPARMAREATDLARADRADAGKLARWLGRGSG